MICHLHYQRHKRGMIVSIGTKCSKTTVKALVVAALIALKPIALAQAKQTNNGSLSGTFVTASFSFDGVAPAILVSFSGNDNVGGPFTGQEVAEYSVTG